MLAPASPAAEIKRATPRVLVRRPLQRPDWRGLMSESLKAGRRRYTPQEPGCRTSIARSSEGAAAAGCGGWLLHVRFGSKADMRAATSHIRFTPNSGYVRRCFVPIADISSLVRHTNVLDVLLIDRLLRRSHCPFAEAPSDRNWMWTVTALEKQPSIHNGGYSATRDRGF
jgi:hypothetical protein